MQQMHPEEAEILLDTHARNAVFKINMPHSQARMPNYLPNEQIRPKPFVPQRRHVHSYIYPSKFDLLRHEMKTKLRDKLNYQYPAKQVNKALANQVSIETFPDYDNSFVEPTPTQHRTAPVHSFKDKSGPVIYRQVGVQRGENVELTLEN